MSNVKCESLSDQIRHAINDSGLTLYRIAKAGKVNAAALTRFMQGKSLTLTSVDRIAGVLGIEIVVNGPGPSAATSDTQHHDMNKDGPRGPRTKKTPQRARRRKAGAKP